MSFRKDLFLFFNLIKTSNENKVSFPTKIKYYKLKKILHILLIYGIILNFGISSNRLYVYINKQSILNIYCLQKPVYLSNYRLQSFISKHPDTVYVISTSLGIFDSKNLFRTGLGGYLLFIIKPKKSLIF
jgi:hypothetical protein